MTNQPSQGTGQASSISWQSRQAAEAWRAMARVHAGVLGQVTERMLDLAALDPGMRVLDVAAGAANRRWRLRGAWARQVASSPSTYQRACWTPPTKRCASTARS